METETCPHEQLENSEFDNKASTESQIFNTLSSSIEDLLRKISKVTHDYENTPLPQSPPLLSSHSISEPKKQAFQFKIKKNPSFSQNREEHSVSTSSHSKVSEGQQKYYHNFFEDTSLFTTYTPKTQQLGEFNWDFHHHSFSLKTIQEQAPKLTKINSLFDNQAIKEVAESRILCQSGEGSFSNLDKNIKQLKHSVLKSSIQEESNKHELQFSDFQLGKEVGSGKFGDVYLCRHKTTGMLFAIKKVFKSVIKEYKMEAQFALELKIMYSLDHPNIVKLYAHFADQYHVFLLMEYLQGGELLSKLGSQQNYVSQTISQMIDAVDYMHSKGIVHRDIKPQNIVVSFDKTVKLCDFGWAGFFDHKTMKTTFCGTLDYVSPEMKDKGQYSSKVDLWSLGVLTYELLTKEAPFKDEIAHWKRKGSHRSQHWDWNIIYPPQVTGLAQSFMRNLLKQNPDDRASLRYCKNHFFIRKYKQTQELPSELTY